MEVTLETTEWKEMLKKKRGGNLRYGGWSADYPDPDSFLRVCVQGSMPHWRNENYARLLDRARRSFNQTERIPLYMEADKILIEEAAIMPLTYGRRHLLVKPWVKIPAGWNGVNSLKDIILEAH